MDKQEEILRILPGNLRKEVAAEWKLRDFSDWQELRLRVGHPYLLCSSCGERQGHTPVKKEELRECLQAAAGYSLYAYEEEIRQGFLTVRGGHRIGLAGQVVLEGGKVRTMKHVSSLNIRIAHEVIGCAKRLAKEVFADGKLHRVLIIAPPGAGKTTLLRDLIRLLSSGQAEIGAVTVGVVDERSELAACYQGSPQHDLGPRTDVLSGCPKADGIYMLLRSMAPDVIAVDEISSPDDALALRQAVGCGCAFFATVHGSGIEEVRKRPALGGIWDQELFDRFVVLRYPVGTVRGVYRGDGRTPL